MSLTAAPGSFQGICLGLAQGIPSPRAGNQPRAPSCHAVACRVHPTRLPCLVSGRKWDEGKNNYSADPGPWATVPKHFFSPSDNNGVVQRAWGRLESKFSDEILSSKTRDDGSPCCYGVPSFITITPLAPIWTRYSSMLGVLACCTEISGSF